jgi:hypothetical protein
MKFQFKIQPLSIDEVRSFQKLPLTKYNLAKYKNWSYIFCP